MTGRRLCALQLQGNTLLIHDPSYSSAIGTDGGSDNSANQAFSIAIADPTDNTDVRTLACGSSGTAAHVHMTPGELKDAINSIDSSPFTSGYRPILNITETLDNVRAKNGKIFNIFYHDEGHPLLTVTPCGTLWDGSTTDSYAGSWSVSTEYAPAGGNATAMGSLYDMSAVDAGILLAWCSVDGTSFHPDASSTVSADTLYWNAETTDVKTYIEATVGNKSNQEHIVDITRAIYGKYGVVEWQVACQ